MKMEFCAWWGEICFNREKGKRDFFKEGQFWNTMKKISCLIYFLSVFFFPAPLFLLPSNKTGKLP